MYGQQGIMEQILNNRYQENLKEMGDEFKRGVEAVISKEYGVAVKHFTCALEAEKNDSYVYCILSNRGFAYLNLDMDQMAETDFTKAISIEPFAQEIYFNKFISLYKQKKHTEALIQLTISLSLALVDKGSKQKDEALIKEALMLVQRNPVGYMELGDLKREKGEYQESKKCYQKGMEIDPNSIRCAMRLFELYQHLNKTEEVKQIEERIQSVQKSKFSKYQFVLPLSEQSSEIVQQQIDRLLERYKLLSFKQTQPNLKDNPIKQPDLGQQQNAEQSIQPQNILQQLQRQLNVSNEVFSDSRAIDEQIQKVEKQIKAAKMELGDESEDEAKDIATDMQKILNFSSRDRSNENIIDQQESPESVQKITQQ